MEFCKKMKPSENTEDTFETTIMATRFVLLLNICIHLAPRKNTLI